MELIKRTCEECKAEFRTYAKSPVRKCISCFLEMEAGWEYLDEDFDEVEAGI